MVAQVPEETLCKLINAISKSNNKSFKHLLQIVSLLAENNKNVIIRELKINAEKYANLTISDINNQHILLKYIKCLNELKEKIELPVELYNIELNKETIALVECLLLTCNNLNEFAANHKKLLNSLIKINNKLIKSTPVQILDFDNKRTYFYSKLRHKYSNTINLNIRRDYIFQDSFNQLFHRSADELKQSKLSVSFADEEAADYGGVSREWYQLLTAEMFNPNYALFTPSQDKMGLTYQPNQSSWVNPSHLAYFKFIGRIIAKAVYDHILLDCYFTRSFYKHMLSKQVDLSDMEAMDPEYSKSLEWIQNNPIDGILDLTFSIEREEFGEMKMIELVENGASLAVTDENKKEYIQKVVETKLYAVIKDQIRNFLEGFHEIIPQELVQIFNEKELELLISGLPDIDIDDWRNNTEYRGYTLQSPQVQWFWRIVRSFDTEERAKLLQFTTGTSKVPLDGFSQLKGSQGVQRFQIHKDFDSRRLPSAHTCFNQIDLPQYDSYEEMREKLLKVVREASTGFGFE